MSKTIALMLIAVLLLSSLVMASSKMGNCSSFPIGRPPQNIQLETEDYTYELPNYNVTYSIKAMPPPDSKSVNPYAFNIVVFGPPPFPIQIEFHQQATDSLPEKMSVIMLTNYYSTSIGCTSYPTQIKMFQLDNESLLTVPTSDNSPTSTPTPELAPTPGLTSLDSPILPLSMQQQVIVGAAFIVAVLAVGLGLLVYLIKRRKAQIPIC